MTVDVRSGILLKSMIVNSSHFTIQLKNKQGELSTSRINHYQNSLVADAEFKFPVIAGKSKLEVATDVCTSM